MLYIYGVVLVYVALAEVSHRPVLVTAVPESVHMSSLSEKLSELLTHLYLDFYPFED